MEGSEQKGRAVYKVLNQPLTLLGANRWLAWTCMGFGIFTYNVSHQVKLTLVVWFFLHMAAVLIHKDDDKRPQAIYRALFWRSRYDASKRLPFRLIEEEDAERGAPPQSFL